MTGIVWFKHSNGDTFFLTLLHQRQHVNTIKEALSLSKCKVKKKASSNSLHHPPHLF